MEGRSLYFSRNYCVRPVIPQHRKYPKLCFPVFVYIFYLHHVEQAWSNFISKFNKKHHCKSQSVEQSINQSTECVYFKNDYRSFLSRRQVFSRIQSGTAHLWKADALLHLLRTRLPHPHEMVHAVALLVVLVDVVHVERLPPVVTCHHHVKHLGVVLIDKDVIIAASPNARPHLPYAFARAGGPFDPTAPVESIETLEDEWVGDFLAVANVLLDKGTTRDDGGRCWSDRVLGSV